MQAKTRRSLGASFRAMFSIDPRSLAFFRVSLAAIVLIDLALRLPDLVAHYTDDGVMPRATWTKLIPSEWVMSLNLLGGTAVSQGALFALTAFAAAALLLGWRTRFASIALYALMLSLHYRNSMILNAGDRILRLLLFWSMFLPLGAVWSLDRRANPDGPAPKRIAGIAAAALLVCIASIYVVTSAMKNGDDWIKDGNAVYYVLNIDMTVTMLGKWLGQFASLLRPMTFSVLAFEWVGPWMLFIPVLFPWPRLVAIAGFLAMHAGFGACLSLGVFPWIDAISLVPFVPAEVWDWLATTRVRPLAGLRTVFSSIVTALTPLTRRSPFDAVRAPLRAQGPGAKVFWGAVALGSFALIEILNVASFRPQWVPAEFASLQYAVGLEQGWGMFAPTPQKFDGWYVIPGKLVGGGDYDVFQDREGKASAEKPANVSATYINARWRSYLLNLYQYAKDDHMQAFGAYLCKSRNSHLVADGKRLESFDIHFIEERTPPPGGSAPVRDINVWSHRCFPAPAAPMTVASPNPPTSPPPWQIKGF